MRNYLKNIWLWLDGWWHLDEIIYKEGWSNGPLWWLVYGLDYGINVLTGGAVEPISTRAHKHRSGVLWDKLLDVIEKWDRGHGVKSGPALWGSVESTTLVQWISLAVWLGLAVYLGVSND